MYTSAVSNIAIKVNEQRRLFFLFDIIIVSIALPFVLPMPSSWMDTDNQCFFSSSSAENMIYVTTYASSDDSLLKGNDLWKISVTFERDHNSQDSYCSLCEHTNDIYANDYWTSSRRF